MRAIMSFRLNSEEEQAISEISEKIGMDKTGVLRMLLFFGLREFEKNQDNEELKKIIENHKKILELKLRKAEIRLIRQKAFFNKNVDADYNKMLGNLLINENNRLDVLFTWRKTGESLGVDLSYVDGLIEEELKKKEFKERVKNGFRKKKGVK